MIESELMTIAECAQFLKVSTRVLRDMVNHPPPGTEPLPFIRVGKRLRFPVAVVRDWMNRASSAQASDQ